MTPTANTPLKIGTRGSPLALAQAYETRRRLMQAHSLAENAFEIVVIKTSGDKILDKPLKEVGGKGLFTKEIEEQMLAGDIHIAVHSMKDMPVEQPNGLILDTFLPREDVRDAFVSANYKSLAALPAGAVVGTSSLRRRAQLQNKRPDLNVVEFRGNVQTRLKKLNDNVADCTFLAMAGLNRLDMSHVANSAIEVDEILPAVAQGAIGIERREDDASMAKMLAPLNHADTTNRLLAERAFLRTLDGSCETPIAALALLEGDQLWLRGEVLRPDGSETLTGERRGTVTDGVEMGADLANEILSKADDDFFSWR
ncbi:MAG: hydroxymethylbilane synthase [Planktomarina sp.]